MPIINACCCWESLKTGSTASAVFTFVTGFINIIIDIWALVGLNWLHGQLEEHERFIFLPPGIIIIFAIELALNFCMLILSFCLAIGINRGYEGERLIYSWIYSMTAFRLFECCLGVYILVWIGPHRYYDILYVMPAGVWISAYWIVNTLLLGAALVCVISYWQELTDELFGKERRVKYYTMLENIRSAARDDGAVTPASRSYYPSRSVSHAASHASIPTKY